ncbi:MAG: InlB B-repeat-containing protein, partial [Bacteroidales bacterium]|nr:InlB B-repeat-containing protein [Bacteroidales bacterium]
MSDYTVAVKDFTNTPTANTTGYIKLQCKNSSSNKGSGVSEVKVTYTAHTITYSATNGSISGTKVVGGATVSTGAYLALGEQVTVTATPASAAYTFESWSVSGTGSSVSTSASTTTFTMGSANTTLTANFVATSSDPTITINTPTGGTITVEDDDDNEIENGDQIAEGTSLYIYAAPAEGYSFDEWSVTETSSGDAVDLLYGTDVAENAFDMPDDDVTVDATFTKNKYNVAVLSVDDITITASYGVSNTITEGNNADVDYQTNISLSASGVTTGKDYNWKITNSSDVDVTASVLSGTTVTVPAYNIKIGATIVNTYTVTYNANGGTGTMTDDDSPYRDGSEVTIMTNTFTRANYAFSGWNTAGNGTGTPYDEGETFTISGDITLYAQWVPSYAITTSATNGTIEVDQSSKPAGATVRLKVTPSSGYALVGLKVKKTSDGSVTDIEPTYNSDLKRYIFTMPAFGVTVKGVFDATNEVTHYFSEIDFSSWDNSYSKHKVTYDNDTVIFASASKQNSGSTIDDIPVTKGSDVSLVMKTVGGVTKKITGATFVCRQWGTKTQTITLHYSTNAGSSYSSTSVTSSNFTISKTDLATGTDAVKITFTSSSNQVGIESATIIIKGDAHSITCDTGLTGGSIYSSPTSASQGEVVELTATPDANYALDSWTVTYTAGGETFSIPVTDNKFTMPNFAVNVTALFRSARDLTVKYSINGTIDDDLEQEVTEGESVDIQGIPDGVTPTGYTFAGWSASASDLSTLLAADDLYTPSDNVTLYAVFTATKPAQFTLSITASDFNSTSYDANNNAKTTAANAVSGETMNVTWTSNQVMLSGGMQWQKNAGYIYNSTDLGTIQSVTITKSAGTFTTYYGTSAQPSSGEAGTGKGYFKTSVGNATGTTSEVKVTFVKSITRKFTRVIDEDVDIDTEVTLSAPAIIESGQTLTIENGGILNAGNYLTILDGGSLIIEDGGQLITTMSGITATVKKEIHEAATKDATYWYAISSAVANPSIASATNIITMDGEDHPTYDLYRFNEKYNASTPWENYRAGHADFTTLEKGRGYLYRNASTLTVSMEGEVNVADIDYHVTITDDGDFAGFNLIGNPYSHNIYKGAGTAIPNGTSFLSTGFYYMDPAEGAWKPGTDNTTPIKPNEGILVLTTSDGDIKMTNTTASASAKYNSDNIMFQVANSKYEDIAYAWFGKGIGLDKINHRNPEVPMLCIRQDGGDY